MSTRLRLSSVLRNKPAPTRSTREIDTCATSKPLLRMLFDPRDAAAAFLQRGADVDARRLKRRRDAEDHADEGGDARSLLPARAHRTCPTSRSAPAAALDRCRPPGCRARRRCRRGSGFRSAVAGSTARASLPSTGGRTTRAGGTPARERSRLATLAHTSSNTSAVTMAMISSARTSLVFAS